MAHLCTEKSSGPGLSSAGVNIFSHTPSKQENRRSEDGCKIKNVSIHRNPHRLSTRHAGYSPIYEQGYPQGCLQQGKGNYMLVITTEKAKRPSAVTHRPLLIHPLATTIGGTMPESTDGKTRAAVAHLNLLRSSPGNAAYFVRLAYVYGLTVPRISEESGLPVEAVQRMVLGGDQ